MYAKRAIPKLKRHRFGLLGKQFIQIGKTAALQGYTPMGLNGLFEPNFQPSCDRGVGRIIPKASQRFSCGLDSDICIRLQHTRELMLESKGP